MAETIRIPDGLDNVEVTLPGGQTFRAPLLETLRCVDQVRAEFQGDPTKSSYDVLDRLIEFVAERNDGVLLTLGQADWLHGELARVYVEKKQERLATFQERVTPKP